MLRTLKRMKDNNPIDWIITEFEDAFLFSAYKKAVILSAIFYVFISFLSISIPYSYIGVLYSSTKIENMISYTNSIYHNVEILNNSKNNLGLRYFLSLYIGAIYAISHIIVFLIIILCRPKSKLIPLSKFQLKASFVYIICIMVMIYVVLYVEIPNTHDGYVVSFWRYLSSTEFYIFAMLSCLYGVVVASTYICISILKLVRFKGEIVDG